MAIIAGIVFTIALAWSIGRWLRPAGRHEALGEMSQRWVTEQRLSQPPDPQR